MRQMPNARERTRCRNSIMYHYTLWNYDTVCATFSFMFTVFSIVELNG
jgi:hypothetical protein